MRVGLILVLAFCFLSVESTRRHGRNHFIDPLHRPHLNRGRHNLDMIGGGMPHIHSSLRTRPLMTHGMNYGRDSLQIHSGQSLSGVGPGHFQSSRALGSGALRAHGLGY